MIWQDIVAAIANIVLSSALIPQVIRGFRDKIAYISLATSIPTTTALFIFSITIATLELYLTAIIMGSAAILWLCLLIQGIKYKKPKTT